MRGILMAEYVHTEVGEEVRSIAGYYAVLEEGMLEYKGREVLYLVKMAVVETSCCGPGGMGFISVPGYIVRLRARQDSQGAWVTDVERIADAVEQGEIAGILKSKHLHFHQVDFM
jgi:hypothetical protein